MLKSTIPFAFEPDLVATRKSRVNSLENLSSIQSKVLTILDNNPLYTLLEVANEVGMSLQGVKKIVKTLQEKNLLIREGSKRDGQWKATHTLK